MDKETLKKGLERFKDLEAETLKDMMPHCSVYINEYVTLYGADDWINDFRSDYLRQRQERGRNERSRNV